MAFYQLLLTPKELGTLISVLRGGDCEYHKVTDEWSALWRKIESAKQVFELMPFEYTHGRDL